MERLRPSPLLAGLSAYAPPRPGAPIDLHLDGNEGRPPPPSLVDAMKGVSPELLRRYPSAKELERELAEHLGIDVERVVVTAGTDDAIERALRAMLTQGRELLMTLPSFGMIAQYAALTGAELVTLPWLEGEYPVDEIIAAVNPRTSVIVVVTPNSPTGLVVTVRDLERISAAAPWALVLVDLAYVEFADVDLSRSALDLPNVVITRTFSKAWGLAGLRVGWAAGSRQAIDWMRITGHPYAVSSLSILLTLERFRTGQDDVQQFVSRVREQRQALSELLVDLGVSVPESQANFVMAKVHDGQWVYDGLSGLGIGVRLFPGDELLRGCLRVTVPGETRAFDRLCHGLRTVLAPEVIVISFGCLEDLDESQGRHARGTLERLGSKLSLRCIADREHYRVESQLASLGMLELFDDVVESPGSATGWGELLESDGFQRAWLVTSSSIEVEVARQAGVLPLAWTPRADGQHTEQARLISAGAGRGLVNLGELEVIVP